MKKIAVLSIFLAFAVLGLPARATVMGVGAGDLIKLVNDGNPATQEDSAVYYLDRDWVRHPFPNRKVYDSWYRDFVGVKELSPADMAQFPLGTPIVYRPGTRLVKIPSLPKVYAVEPGGMLRWITTESVATTLYGADWSKMVDDVDESFFLSYTEGVPMRLPVWPTGTVVRSASDNTLYVIEGLKKRLIPVALQMPLRLDGTYAVSGTPEQLSEYEDMGAIAGEEMRYTDTSQISRVETLPPPQVDFPATEVGWKAAEPVTLATLRLTAGEQVRVKGITAVIEGPLWTDSSANLTDLAFVDMATGENLFGTKQLGSAPGAASETFTMSGSWTTGENVTAMIALRGTVSVNVPPGTTFTVSFPRSGLVIHDAAGADKPRAFAWPAAE